MTSRPSRPRRFLLAVGLIVAVVATSCSDDDPSASTTTSAPTTDDGASPSSPGSDGAAPPEQFSGALEDFYLVPDPLPEGAPGELIRVMDVGESEGARTLRIMYHSRDAQDRDRAVTGTVTYPTGDAPDGGWPVVSWAHGTSGLAAPCAPSRTEQPAPGFGVEGVHVATDYIGLGPIHEDTPAGVEGAAAVGGVDGRERHPYLSKLSEGHSVIDAVRAVRLLPEAHASDRWFAIGHSQGGHAALSAHELGASYAPELDLLGTVALAPGAVFDKTYGGIDEIVAPIVSFMGLYGAATEYPEIDPADYVTPEAAAAATVLDEACIDEVTEALLAVGVGAESLYAHDPRTTEPAASLFLANDVGKTAADAPLYLVSGTVDDRVVIDRVRDLNDRLCAAGQVTELLVVEGADHGTIIPQTAEQTTAWLEARLAGTPPIDTCTEG